jgi:hypothetical protein
MQMVNWSVSPSYGQAAHTLKDREMKRAAFCHDLPLYKDTDLPETLSNPTGKSRRTAELIGELAESVTESRLRILHPVLLPPSSVLHPRFHPRRRTRTTKVEKILAPKKRADSIHAVDREPIAVADAPQRKPARECRSRRA